MRKAAIGMQKMMKNLFIYNSVTRYTSSALSVFLFFIAFSFGLQAAIPNVAAVSSPATNSNLGSVVTITVNFDIAVAVNTSGGSPTLLLETGAVDRLATYTGGSVWTTFNTNAVVTTIGGPPGP